MRKLISVFILFFSFFLSSQEPLFTLIDSEKTGITFSNDLVDTKDHSIFLYANYYGGAGVGIGDFDNDGLEDIFLAANLIDDKIYINTNTTVDVLHVIHEPDKKGKACDFEQHGVQLPTLNAFTMPNNPYYGLGPLDGSLCDTLNINNPPPLADFVYQADSSFQVDFYDKSLYQAETWSWNFGDGNFSTERFPSHQYDLPAIYMVCLTVTSPMGSDTYCQDVNLEITSTDQVIVENSIFSIFPNPCQDDFAISTTGVSPKN